MPAASLLQEARQAAEVRELSLIEGTGGRAAEFLRFAELAQRGEGLLLSPQGAAQLLAVLAQAVEAGARGAPTPPGPFSINAAFAFRRPGAVPVIALFCRLCGQCQIARLLPGGIESSPRLPTGPLGGPADELLLGLSATYRR